MSDHNLVLVEKLEELVLFLSGGWRVDKLSIDDNSYRFFIIGSNGMRVGFRHAKGLINVFPVWPRIDGNQRGQHYNNYVSPKGRGKQLSINFSLERSTKSLAKDIERRFLNDYVQIYSECLIEKKKIIDKRSKLTHIVNAFKRVYRTSYVSGCVDAVRLSFGSSMKGATGEINLSVSSDYCTMSLNYVPFDAAMRITAILKEYESNERG